MSNIGQAGNETRRYIYYRSNLVAKYIKTIVARQSLSSMLTAAASLFFVQQHLPRQNCKSIHRSLPGWRIGFKGHAAI